jgi:hypothetical protein
MRIDPHRGLEKFEFQCVYLSPGSISSLDRHREPVARTATDRATKTLTCKILEALLHSHSIFGQIFCGGTKVIQIFVSEVRP